MKKGSKHTEETKRKIGLKSIGRTKTPEGNFRVSIANTGERNAMWKGNNVGYRTLHKWVERHLGKATQCMNNYKHKSTRYHWANISKKYKRDLSDWIQLCPSCNCKDRVGRRVSP